MTDVTHTLIAADLAALVDALPIEPGGVRSTRIHKGPGARIVRLSMDAGAVMKEHLAQAPLLVSVLDGRVALEVGGERIELGAGGLLQIAERVPHAVEALAPSHLLLILGVRAATTPEADAAG